MKQGRDIFVISDFYMGDGGPRDNFAVGDKEIFCKIVGNADLSCPLQEDILKNAQETLGKFN